MFEKGQCNTCGVGNGSFCKECNWRPSELYTAYLQEEERADKAEAEATDLQESHMKLYGEMKQWKSNCRDALRRAMGAEAKAERFRAALNCEKCGGEGWVAEYTYPVGFGKKTCPTCAEIRKEARGE